MTKSIWEYIINVINDDVSNVILSSKLAFFSTSRIVIKLEKFSK